MAKLNNLSDLKKLFPEAEGTYTPPNEEKGGLPKQYLEAHFSNKGRGGKTVTIIKGFTGAPEALKSLAKALKQHCGVGGSIKDQDIIIQGNMRDKIMTFLQNEGHQVKRVGG
jgi:translation initiation factor 1